MLATSIKSMKLQMNGICESGRNYIGNRYGAKRATVYALDACNWILWLEGKEQKTSGEKL